MSDPFESAIFSINRAKRHVRDFNTLADEFMAGEPYTTRTDFDPDARTHQVKVKVIREIPEDLRGYASDAVKNIRDALDQAMSAASFVISGKRGSRSHFPFGESADDLEDSLSRRKAFQCRGIPEELFPAIRFIKPYPHEGDQFRLKLLQKVSGPHKHSVALTLGTAAATPFAELEMRGVDQDGSPVTVSTTFHEWDSSEEEVIVATTTGLPPDGNMQLSQPFHIALDHPELKSIPASRVLGGWGRRTEWVIAGLKAVAETIVAERGR